ncbi:MAG: hypothetical protein ACJA0H_001332, partial [Francisellaceae bacterium]
MVTVVKKCYDYEYRDKEKRNKFIAGISNIDPKLLVYCDESGKDVNERYDYGYSTIGKSFTQVGLA